MLADVISIFVYEVPCVFWRYINVDEVSLISLKSYYKVRWNYYKSRQVLQGAMIITNCDSTPHFEID